MDPDDAADVVEELSDPEAEEILIRMAPEEAAEIRELADFPTESAGGIMTPEFVAVPRDARAAEAIAAIRRLVDEAETVNYVYVVDAERRSPRRAVAVPAAAEPGRTRRSASSWRPRPSGSGPTPTGRPPPAC